MDVTALNTGNESSATKTPNVFLLTIFEHDAFRFEKRLGARLISL